MKQTLFLAVFASVLVTASPAWSADEAKTDANADTKVKQLVKKQCGGCHGDDGNSVKPTVPKLAGQHADYLYKQLRNFKATDGKPAGPSNPMYPTPSDLVYIASPEGKLPERTNPLYFVVMNGMVKDLTDADMKAVAVYFSEQTRKSADSVTKSGEGFEAAQRLYRVGDAVRHVPSCAGCHGPTGDGLPAQFPRLSGQLANYTLKQLKNFRAGYRTNDPNRMMRDITYRLTEEEIEALSDYIAGLR
ncbi:Cytochrome c4 [Georgfuchsia toluolica]|uniref:Cytochrome c4 n=1 Tax=Georgfuchsia toluolica TaxID=424218 RepID=A0A916J4S8_9PROT|nr:c-type cytochrome [Georgfuchsia toluolica]CAG4883895.1 Cytochrome c4 [Georgfuchsia toluolica]